MKKHADGPAGKRIDFHRIVDALPELVWTMDRDRRCGFANRRWHEYTGLTPNEVLDQGWRSALHPDDIARFLRDCRSIVGSNAPGETEARLRRFDGEHRWFTVRFVPMAEGTKEDSGWCASATYSDEIAPQATVSDFPDPRLQRFVDMIPTQVVLMTPALELEYVNPQVLDFFGMPLDELKQWATSGKVQHPDDLTSILERLERLHTLGEPWDSTTRMLRADGAYRWVRSRMVPSRDAQGNVVRYCSVQTDVDDLKRAEAILAGEVRLLEMVARSKPLLEVLDTLSRLVDDLCPGCLCSILLVSADRRHLEVGAGPSLPDAYNAVLNGQAIDGGYGPFSRAVIEKSAVITADVVNDRRWEGSGWPSLMKTCGYASCWSMPIMSGSGEVSGIFAIHRREPAGPTSGEQELINRFTKLAGIAIERTQVDEALQVSERQLRRAHAQLSEGQRLSRTGSFTSDLHLDQHSWSAEFYRIFGIDPGTRPSVQAVRDQVHPDDLDAFDQQVQRGLEGKGSDFTFRILTPAGELKCLRGVAQLIEHTEGRPIFIGTVQDITESKLVEAALKASEADLRRANSYLTDAQRLSKTGSFTWDVLSDEHDWSGEILRIFDFEPGTAVSMPLIASRVHPADMPEVQKVIGGAVNGQDFDLVFRIYTMSGEIRHAHVVGHQLGEISDRPVFLGALRDVTESKEAEAAIRASEAELKRANHYLTTAQRLSKTGSFMWDLATDERQWSEEMYRLFNLDPATAVPFAATSDLVHPDDVPIVELLTRKAREGRDFDGEFRLLTPSGSVKNVHVVGHLLGGSHEPPVFVGAAQDVTELTRRQEALNEARAELAHVARTMTLSALTASMAHEVSQPLSGILTNLNTCLRMLTADPPNPDGAAETIRRAIRDTNRATEVIKRLRALFARKEPAIEFIKINEVAREVIALTSSELQRSRVIIQTDFAPDLPRIGGDRVQLQQVILNLLLNAADAMSEVEDRPRNLCVQTRRDGSERITLSVQDAGVGVPPETLEKLFNPFYTTKPHGMGVGLSISRSIIESHDGRLWAKSNDGPGATFSFSLPCALGVEAEFSGETRISPPSALPDHSMARETAEKYRRDRH